MVADSTPPRGAAAPPSRLYLCLRLALAAEFGKLALTASLGD